MSVAWRPFQDYNVALWSGFEYCTIGTATYGLRAPNTSVRRIELCPKQMGILYMGERLLARWRVTLHVYKGLLVLAPKTGLVWWQNYDKNQAQTYTVVRQERYQQPDRVSRDPLDSQDRCESEV